MGPKSPVAGERLAFLVLFRSSKKKSVRTRTCNAKQRARACGRMKSELTGSRKRSNSRRAHNTTPTTTTDDAAMATGDLQNRVRFAAPPTDDEHEPRAASGTAHAHYDRPASENERQQQHTSTHNQPRTQTYHHPLDAAALAAIASKHAAQHPAGLSAAA